MEISGPIIVRRDYEVIENKIIIVEPTSEDDKSNDFAIKVAKDNVVIRNCVIYHATNGIGIFGWRPYNLTIENV